MENLSHNSLYSSQDLNTSQAWANLQTTTKVHYRPNTHKDFSNTVTMWPQNICCQCHLNTKQTLHFWKEWKLTIQIIHTMVLKGLASSNARGPTLMFRSIHVLSCSTLLCVQCLCSQSVNKPNIGGSVCPSGSTYCELPYLENISLVPKPNRKASIILKQLAKCEVYITSGTKLWCACIHILHGSSPSRH
jgi:hypothetical protein